MCVWKGCLSSQALCAPHSCVLCRASTRLFHGDLKEGWESVECGIESLSCKHSRRWLGPEPGVEGRAGARHGSWLLRAAGSLLGSSLCCLLPVCCPHLLHSELGGFEMYGLLSSRRTSGRPRTPTSFCCLSACSFWYLSSEVRPLCQLDLQGLGLLSSDFSV